MIRELSPSESDLAHAAMRELRPAFDTVEAFVQQVNHRQRPDGYRLVASFEGEDAAAVAGFRTGNSLSWGHYLYVDDLVTREEFRRRGHARNLLTWIAEEARRLGCRQVHLDSGSHRHDAHRLYLINSFRISGFHFVLDTG